MRGETFSELLLVIRLFVKENPDSKTLMNQKVQEIINRVWNDINEAYYHVKWPSSLGFEEDRNLRAN